ncbi:MAG: hypothetical protein ABIR05_08350, partial [Luteimonas sp.]
IVLAALVSAPVLMAPALAAPQSRAQAPAEAPQQQTEAQRIAALEARIEALEAQLQQVLAVQGAAAQGAAAQGVAAQPVAAEAAPAAPAPPVDDFESLAAAPEASATGSSGVAPAPAQPASSVSGGGNAFNPAVSIILNGSLAQHSGASDADGFSLGESEISFAANIDDKFYGQLTLAIGSEGGEDKLGVEEAFVDTTALPGGLAVRAGRFFSNIGYLNNRHAHTDSFFDRPLAYQVFLGDQYGDDGVQLRWVAPTSTFLELGGEVFRGGNDALGARQRGGLDTRTLFAHTGGSVGSDNEWLAGVSVLDTSDTTLYIADGTWKWAPQGNFKDGGVTLRSEYLRDQNQSGAYVEAVYRLNRTWDIGYRYDRLWLDNAVPFANAFNPDRHTAEVTWRNSEFSLLRLQLSHGRMSNTNNDDAVTLQYQTSLGAHGAHKF